MNGMIPKITTKHEENITLEISKIIWPQNTNIWIDIDHGKQKREINKLHTAIENLSKT